MTNLNRNNGNIKAAIGVRELPGPTASIGHVKYTVIEINPSRRFCVCRSFHEH